MTQSKVKSWLLWLSIIVMVGGAVTSSGIFTDDMVLRLIALGVSIASGIIGIINNPDNKVGW